jgi:hypothetical protein
VPFQGRFSHFPIRVEQDAVLLFSVITVAISYNRDMASDSQPAFCGLRLGKALESL